MSVTARINAKVLFEYCVCCFFELDESAVLGDRGQMKLAWLRLWTLTAQLLVIVARRTDMFLSGNWI